MQLTGISQSPIGENRNSTIMGYLDDPELSHKKIPHGSGYKENFTTLQHVSPSKTTYRNSIYTADIYRQKNLFTN